MNNSSILCAFGIDLSLLSKADKLIFVEDRLEMRSLELPLDVQIYWVETPLQLQGIAQEISRSSVLVPFELCDVSKSPLFSEFETLLQKERLNAELLVNDAADFGISFVVNALQNLQKPFRRLHSLQGGFKNSPAVLMGAGPSLQKNSKALSALQNKALVFAGGTAISQAPCVLDFAVCIDKERPIASCASQKTPLLFQARMHPGNLHVLKGPRILIPESHFPFLNTLAGESTLFESGWTVGNLMVSLALFLGCNPIICVGMDFCYLGGKKYSFGIQEERPLVPAKNLLGQDVWTQPDFLMASEWMRTIEKQHPETNFFNASGGLPFFTPCALEDLVLPEIIKSTLPEIPLETVTPRPLWKAMLKRARDDVERESIYEELLMPLWNVWGPIFERESTLDMELQKKIFFSGVIREHLQAL